MRVLCLPGQSGGRFSWERMALAAVHGSVNYSPMSSIRGIIGSLSVTILLVLALVSSGFAHRFVSASEQVELQILQTLGIDRASICGNENQDDVSEDCEACRLHACMSLPEPALSIADVELLCRPALWAQVPNLCSFRSLARHRLARAPPLV